MLFELNRDLLFPPVHLAEPDGMLAYGGDLSVDRLLLAYKSGIFPWFNEENPIIWWSPNPRFVIFPERVHFSRSMKKILKRGEFEIFVDRDFRRVIRNCAVVPRGHQKGTWITDRMRDAYIILHEEGYAHSFEAWQDGELVGGLYGISLGRLFFGESMFQHASNASKAAFLTMTAFVRELGFLVIDSQVYTKHLASLGAEHISRDDYLKLVRKGLEYDTIRGSWAGLYSSVTSSRRIFPFDVS
ncbi:MAG: leucyl/phenylalanyl-tRNA--protein transferase [Spirochaetota bacterium]